MKRAFVLPFVVILTAFTMSPSWVSEKAVPEGRIAWVTEWDKALTQAKAEKKPIMIHFNMDDEPACRNMARDHLKNKKVLALSKKFVCVVASLGHHETEKVFDGSHRADECRRFGTVSCGEHRKLDEFARSDALETRTVTAPQFVFLTPDLEIIVRRPWDMSANELIKLMQRSLFYFNPSMAPPELEAKRKALLKNLLDEAASDNARIRTKALDSLANRDDPEIIKFLIRQTGADKDEVKRNEAVKAIGEAGNANCLPTLVGLLRDRSQRLRKNTLIALSKLGMVECVAAVIKAYGIESSTRNRALMIRTAVSCAPKEAGTRKLLSKALKINKKMVRVHAVRSTVEVNLTASEFQKIIGMAKGDTDRDVRAVACHACTTVGLRTMADSSFVGGMTEADYPDLTKVRKLTKKKLLPALRKVAGGDRSPELREYAAACLQALKDPENGDHESGLDEFHDDDDLFKEEEDNGTGRSGGGGRR